MVEKEKSLTVVVPCYNEELRFPKEQFYKYLLENTDLSFCFVNDGSTDQTSEILEDLLATFSERVSLLHLEVNRGKAEAIRQGVLYLLKTNDIPYIAYIDADLAAPLSELGRLNVIIKQNKDLRFIFGSRVAVFGSNIQRLKLRHYGGRVIATLVDMLLKMKIYDTQCGLKIFDRGMASDLFYEPFITRWFFDVEIFARLKRKYSGGQLKNQMREYPLSNWVEMGASKVKVLDVCRIPIDLFKIYLKYNRSLVGLSESTSLAVKETVEIDPVPVRL